MAGKRSAEGTYTRPDKKVRFHATVIDQTFGQRSVFSVDAGAAISDEELHCEDATDALAYLRSVRQEAGTIPHVVRAQTAGPQLPEQAANGVEDGSNDDAVDRSIYANGIGDFRGYYDDGAYIALPDDYYDEDDAYDEEDEEDPDEVQYEDGEYSEMASTNTSEDRPHNSSSDEIHKAYYDALLKQHQSLRKILQTTPPDSIIATLPRNSPCHVESLTKAFMQWRGRLQKTEPLPAQVAAMSKLSVVRLLNIIVSAKLLQKEHELSERTSRWIWALLARLPEIGSLNSHEVACVRELGKRAVLLMLSLAEAAVLQEHRDVGESEDDIECDAHESPDEDFSPRSSDVSSGTQRDNDGASDPEDHAPTVPTVVPQETPTKVNTGAEVVSQELDGSLVIPTVAPSENLTTQGPRPPSHSNAEMRDDTSMKDGEVSDRPLPQGAPAAEPEAIKTRLLVEGEASHTKTEDNLAVEKTFDDASRTLARDVDAVKARLLVEVESFDTQAGGDDASTRSSAAATTSMPADAGKPDTEEEGDQRLSAQVNLRVTLNMILTVVGECYGQRDLLEFRDPFGTITEE